MGDSVSSSNRVIIPLDHARNMGDVAEFILKNRCGQTPAKAGVAGYKQAMEIKGTRAILDLKKKDTRLWPRIAQWMTNTIVVKESDVPACPVIDEIKKPEAKVLPPASQPVQVKPEEKKTAAEPEKIKKPATKNGVRRPPETKGVKIVQ